MISRRFVLDDGRAKRDVPLTGTVVIGRDPACHVSDPDPLLSRRHAEVVTGTGAVTIRDLGSRNGILVNGRKMSERVLVPGDLVQVGRLQFLYVEEVTAPVIEPQPPPRPVAKPAPVATMVIHDIDMPLAAAERPILKPLPTGNEPTFIPDNWRGATPPAARVLDDTAPSMRSLVEDIDATRMPGAFSLRDLDDMDATGALTRIDFDALARSEDETMLTLRAPAAAPPAPLAPGQARLVTGPSLIVSEASAAGENLFGMTPQSLVGASIPDLVVRALGLMVAGEGPAAVTLRAERRHPDGYVTVTFTTGQTIEK